MWGPGHFHGPCGDLARLLVVTCPSIEHLQGPSLLRVLGTQRCTGHLAPALGSYSQVKR